MGFFTILLMLVSLIISYSDNECPVVTFTINSDRRSDKNRLRLVQYNVEWLFIDYYAPMDCPGSGCTWHSTNEAMTHLSYVTDTIRYLNPDILNLCEVEGCDELHQLTQNLNKTIYTPYLKQGTDTSTGQNVGLITKINPLINLYRSEEKVGYPIPGTICGSTNITGTEGVTKHYITEYKFGSYNVALIGVHLLAIPTDPNRCIQREAQAQVIQNIIFKYISKGYEIIIMGDMNDYDSEVSDIRSSKPTSRVLDILKGLNGLYARKYNLTNVAYRIQKEERFSDWWDSDNNCTTNTLDDLSMIDHILVTPNIEKKIIDVFIYHGYEEYCGKWNSDHWPVVVDLDLSL
jgi:exonuclease III